jgi:hypothetical protein
MDIPNPGADLCIAKWKCKGHYFNMATKGTWLWMENEVQSA